MKDLNQYNLERARELVQQKTFPKPNGIACPHCANELEDTDGQHLLVSPVKTKVKCPSCGFTGYRLV